MWHFITFFRAVTPNSWLIFKNTIEHESTLVRSSSCGLRPQSRLRQRRSGHKIVLKANLVHLHISPHILHITKPPISPYANSFAKLIESKHSVITQFKSKPYSVLPTYNISEYMFYRDCFKSDPNVIPQLGFAELAISGIGNTFSIY